MICVSLPGPGIEDLRRQLLSCRQQANMLELRLDLYDDPQAVRQLEISLPFIITCRPRDQGGAFRGDEERRLALLTSFLDISPDFIDIEYYVKADFSAAGAKVIRSYHNFHKTPKDLSFLFDKPADLYKIACRAESALEGLHLLKFLKTCQKPVAGHDIGEEAAFTRILGKIFGSRIIYASPPGEESTAPGQISVDKLRDIYHLHTLGGETDIYALLGDPVKQSIGHIFHNRYMKDRGAVYVKMRVSDKELRSSVRLALELGFKGFSVTTPHKERVAAFLDDLDENARDIGAVNTIKKRDGCLIGYNTDAEAALDLLGEVKNKKMSVIGAGGAARAIVYEAKKRGALITIFNRTDRRAKSLAEIFSCDWAALSEIAKSDSDIMINASCSGMPIPNELIPSGKVVMDINIEKTPFLLQAEKRGCTIIEGTQMFIGQAKAQKKIWFEEKTR